MRWVAWTCKVVVDWAGQSVPCSESLFLTPSGRVSVPRPRLLLPRDNTRLLLSCKEFKPNDLVRQATRRKPRASSDFSDFPLSSSARMKTRFVCGPGWRKNREVSVRL
jgi:hypothetical protein